MLGVGQMHTSTLKGLDKDVEPTFVQGKHSPRLVGHDLFQASCLSSCLTSGGLWLTFEKAPVPEPGHNHSKQCIQTLTCTAVVMPGGVLGPGTRAPSARACSSGLSSLAQPSARGRSAGPPALIRACSSCRAATWQLPSLVMLAAAAAAGRVCRSAKQVVCQAG